MKPEYVYGAAPAYRTKLWLGPASSVASTTGVAGSIADTSWGRTRIDLTPGGQRFILARNTSDVAGTAVPSSLRDAGTAFDVTYGTTTVARTPAMARDARARYPFGVAVCLARTGGLIRGRAAAAWLPLDHGHLQSR